MAFFEWLKQSGPAGLESMGHKFEQMLEDGRHVFDLAANGLLAGGDPEVFREDLFSTDRRINRTEIEIRRQLVVHGSVTGAQHLPELLVMMSLVKDAERIGDYAKNLYDLAAQGDLLPASEKPALIEAKDEISRLLVRGRNIYSENNQPGAVEFLKDAGELEDRCDASVARLLKVGGENMAAAVLTYRYFKRVASHASNIVTSLVVSVDQLDYFDEPKPGQ